MFRTTSVVAFGLALGLVTAPLAFAQQATKAPETSKIQSQTSPAKAKSTSKHMTSPKVDLNTATRDELTKLPGIDGATADKIVEARPFKSKSELRSKGLVTKVEYGKIASHVIAKPATAAGK